MRSLRLNIVKKLKWLWLFILTGFAGLYSCEEIMDVSFIGDSEQRLVVEGSITTDTLSHRVKLSFTGDYFAKEEKVPVTGAEVTITDGDTIYPLREQLNGEYYTDINAFGLAGRTYTLDIRLQDGREYTASDHLGTCGKIDSIAQSVNYNTRLYGYGYDVLFYGLEPGTTGDYYLYLLYLDGQLYTDTITEVNFVSDEFVNGNYIVEFPVYRIREADLLENAANVTLEMCSISKEYYDFLSAMKIETVWRGSPWDGPPANIPGNVSNGASGFFRASAVARIKKYFLPFERFN